MKNEPEQEIHDLRVQSALGLIRMRKALQNAQSVAEELENLEALEILSGLREEVKALQEASFSCWESFPFPLDGEGRKILPIDDPDLGDLWAAWISFWARTAERSEDE